MAQTTTRGDRLTQTGKISVIYSDFPDSFAAIPSSCDLARVVNADAVKQSLRNIVMTNTFERPFQPNVGTNVRASLFELESPTTYVTLQNNILLALSQQEPRANILSVVVTGQPDLNSVTVTISFTMINDTVPLTCVVLLRKIR
jgi:hypothetical protein